jgi:hypothetical protein
MIFLLINKCTRNNVPHSLKVKEYLLLENKNQNYFLDKYFTFPENMNIVSISTLMNDLFQEHVMYYFQHLEPLRIQTVANITSVFYSIQGKLWWN